MEQAIRRIAAFVVHFGKLPILNREKLKELFAAPTLLKQRIVLVLIYSAGLRGQQAVNLKRNLVLRFVPQEKPDIEALEKHRWVLQAAQSAIYYY